MKHALLVAMRDFSESARTKGFWLGILLFPLIIFISVQVPVLIGEKAVPQRNFILVDQSGEFEEIVKEGMERFHQRQVLKAMVKYVQKHAMENTETNSAKVDLESIPAPDGQVERFLDDFASANPAAVDAFMEKGGQDMVLNQLERFIGEGASPFEEPRRRFTLVPLPDSISVDQSVSRRPHRK